MKKNIFFPLLLLFTGGFLALRAFGVFDEFPAMSSIYGVIASAFAVKLFFSKDYIFSFLFLVFGFSLFNKTLDYDVNFLILYGSAFFIGLALQIMFKKDYRNKFVYQRVDRKDYFNNSQNNFSKDDSSSTQDDILNLTVSIGNLKKYVNSNNFTKGNFSANMGELKVYFNSASLNSEGADVYLDCNMGNLELFIPRSWSVSSNISTSLGHVDDSRYNYNDTTPPVLRISGHCKLGNIKINYI